jgi:hypothetical protein
MPKIFFETIPQQTSDESVHDATMEDNQLQAIRNPIKYPSESVLEAQRHDSYG